MKSAPRPPANQPVFAGVSASDADSERSERYPDVPRTYGDVLAADPFTPAARQAVAVTQLETFRTSLRRERSVRNINVANFDFGHDQAPPKIEISVISEAEQQAEGERRAWDLESGGEVLADRLADDPRAHYFRRAVALCLEPHWQRRAAALWTCGEAGARCDCGDCGAPHVLPYRCGARACPTCAGVASAVACERVARKATDAALTILGPWDGRGPERKKAWRTLVLTTAAAKTEAERYDPETLRAAVLAVRGAIGPFWRSTSWGKPNDVTIRDPETGKAIKRTKRVRRDTLAAFGLEGGDGGMIHVHAAVYGEFIDEAELARLWKLACPIGGFVRIRLMREYPKGPAITDPTSEGFRNALREVLKYLTKGHETDTAAGGATLARRARKAAAMEFAFRNQRRVETCGALRLVAKVSEKDVATQQKPCMACTHVPASWKWRGVRAPEYVRRNGGFGLSHTVDDADAALTRAERTSVFLAEQQRAREIEWGEAHHYRPGGKFYGGTAPPWIDDPEEWDTVSEGHSPFNPRENTQ